MDRFWTEHYPVGVAKEIDLTCTDTLNDLFTKVCKKYPENRAFTSHGETITFAKTEEYVDTIAKNLSKLGVKKGDRIAIIMPNLIQYPLSVFACFRLGAIVVNINPLYTPAEIDYLLENSGAKTVIVLNLIAGKLNDLHSKHSLQNVIITKIPDIYRLPKRLFMNFAIKYIKKLKVNYTYATTSFRDLLKVGCYSQSKPQVVTTSDLAFIQYTGATTGKPKGVMLSHYNIVANLAQIYAWLTPQVSDLDKQVVIDALPLYHIFSLTANLLTFFFTGSENVMILNPHDVTGMVNTLVSTPFTIFSALDTLYNHLLQSKEFKANRYPHYKYGIAGGMKTRAEIAEAWFKSTGVMPANCYGLSECSPAVTLNPLNNTFDGSVGFPVPSMDLEIRDIKTNAVLPHGEIGQIWIKGPQVTQGYWQNEEKTQKAFDAAGWFATKDLGYFTPIGKLVLSGRSSEMIIVSGFNVYPVEIEDVLNGFPEIQNSAVMGIPDENTGERVVAFVSLVNGSKITAGEITGRCKKDLAAYKVPHYVYIKDDFPKTLVGKIDKNALKHELLENRN